MAQQPNITVEFRAKGAKALVAAINKLSRAQGNLEQKQHLVNQRVSSNTKAMNQQGGAIKKIQGHIAIYRNSMLLASFAIGVVTQTIVKALEAYGKQEKAILMLNAQLGYNTIALQENASAMQKQFKVGDEVILQSQALIAGFTKNEEHIIAMTEASLNLSAVLGQDLNQSSALVAKTIFSSTNALERYGISVHGAVGSTERMESTISAVNLVFGEMAEVAGSGAIGRIKELTDSFGDFTESIGELIVWTGATETMQAYSFFIDKLSGSHKDFSNNAKDSHEEIQKQHNELIMTIRSTDDMSDALDILTELQENHNILVEKNGDLLAEQEKRIKEVEKKTYGWKDAIDQLGDTFMWWWNILTRPWDTEINKITNATNDNTKAKIEQRNSTIGIMEAEIQYNKLLREQLPLLNEIALAEYNIDNAKRGGIPSLEKSLELAGMKVKQLKVETSMAKDKLKNELDITRAREAEAKIVPMFIRQQMELGESYTHAGKAASAAMNDILKAEVQVIFIKWLSSIMNAKGIGIFGKTLLLAGSSAFVGSLINQAFSAASAIKFEQGGLVGGRRHSQGGTMIEAEQGEYVLNRDAVESIGVNNLERMNQGGGAQIVINNPIISSQYVEEELPDLIAEAVRKGADFGLS